MRSRANAQVNFQRRHFEAIARIVASFTNDPKMRDSLAKHFALGLRWTNANFDSDKFIQWANGDERSASDIARNERINRKIERELKREEAKAQALRVHEANHEAAKYYKSLTKLAGVGKTENVGG